MHPPVTAPPPANRPKLWGYYRERGLSPAAVGNDFGRSAEWVRLLCLPFGDPKRRVPSPEDVERFHEWSQGVLGPPDWYPPELTTAARAPGEEARP